MPHPFGSSRTTCNCAIEITSGSGLGLIQIRVQMRIQCGHTQTGFDPVQYALGVQCGQSYSHKYAPYHLSLVI